MQRESARRGFSIQHQKVALHVDLAGFIRGYTEITIVPNIPSLRTIHIHSRQCTIHHITIADTAADFVLQDPFANLGPTKPDDVHSFPEIKRKMFSAFSDADEGELSIAIPSSLLPVPRSLQTPTKDSLLRETQGALPNSTANPSSEFAPLTVVIHYSLRSPHDGVHFVLPTDTYPYVSMAS
jgi:transcription initiation factor TFIID subunit 2